MPYGKLKIGSIGKCEKSVKLERIKEIPNVRAKVVHVNTNLPFQNDKFLSIVCI